MVAAVMPPGDDRAGITGVIVTAMIVKGLIVRDAGGRSRRSGATLCCARCCTNEVTVAARYQTSLSPGALR
jgi:hypothetical protein